MSGAGYLHKLNDSMGMAKCLDGSPMAYYYRPGTGTGKNKWLLSYEGTEGRRREGEKERRGGQWKTF
jgi:hypothetical protein